MLNPFDVPCMEYTSSFKVEDLKEVELKITYDDRTKSTAKCPRFTGKGGIEELFYIVESVENIAIDEDIEDSGKFLYFNKKVLEQNPRNKWMSLNPETYPQDEDGFKDCVKKFYTKYSSQVNPRDILLIKSLRSK